MEKKEKNEKKKLNGNLTVLPLLVVEGAPPVHKDSSRIVDDILSLFSESIE